MCYDTLSAWLEGRSRSWGREACRSGQAFVLMAAGLLVESSACLMGTNMFCYRRWDVEFTIIINPFSGYLNHPGFGMLIVKLWKESEVFSFDNRDILFTDYSSPHS